MWTAVFFLLFYMQHIEVWNSPHQDGLGEFKTNGVHGGQHLIFSLFVYSQHEEQEKKINVI